MNKLDNYISMLQEFDYRKNGKELSIDFLKFILISLEMTNENEWKTKND